MTNQSRVYSHLPCGIQPSMNQQPYRGQGNGGSKAFPGHKEEIHTRTDTSSPTHNHSLSQSCQQTNGHDYGQWEEISGLTQKPTLTEEEHVNLHTGAGKRQHHSIPNCFSISNMDLILNQQYSNLQYYKSRGYGIIKSIITR